MFDEYIHGLGEFVREDDYDFYDFFIDIIDRANDYLEYVILEDFNAGDMEDIEQLCDVFLREKSEKKKL